MKNIFSHFANTGILVIGDLMADQYIIGKVRRISPEAPVPVVEIQEETLLLGGAANVANNVQSLGGQIFIAGIAGQDENGKILINKLRQQGFHTEGIIIDQDRPTTVKTRVIANHQQVVRFDKEVKQDLKKPIQKKLLDYVISCFPKIKGIIISDYCKGVVTRSLIKKIIDAAPKKIFITVDPKIGHFDFYKGVDLITPNLNEASFGAGIDITDEKSLLAAGKVLLKKLQCGAAIITRGDEGMSLFEKNGKITHIPTFAREVYDVSGAGDTVIATLTLSHAAGATLSESAILANHAAGVVVGKAGTATATTKELLQSLKNNNPLN